MLKIIREPECRIKSGLERTQRWKMEKEGTFPKRINISKNAIGWLAHEIDEWIQSKAQESRNRGQEDSSPSSEEKAEK